MKKHNTIKVLVVTILILGLLSWIIPAAYYQSTLQEQGRVQMGLFDLFNYPLTAVSYFGYIAVFVLVVGGFYGILHKIPAYRTLLDRIVYNLRGNEKLFIVVMMILLAVLTSICGVQLALLIFFPFIASIILLLGYDKMVVALTLVGSTMIGMLGTTMASSNVSIIFQALSKVKISSAMPLKVSLLLIGLCLLIINTLIYIKKHSIVGANVAAKKTVSTVESKKATVKKVETKSSSNSSAKKNTKTNKTGKKTTKSTKKNSNKADLVDEDVIVVSEELENASNEFVPKVVDGTYKIWPLVLSMVFMALILVLAFIPWDVFFKTNPFEGITTGLTAIKLHVWIALLIGMILLVGITYLVTGNGKKTLVALIDGIIAILAAYTVTAGNITGFILLALVLVITHVVAKKVTGDMVITSCLDLIVSLIYVLIFAAATGFGTFFKSFGTFFVGKGKFEIFGKFLGTTNPFGSWTINDLIPLMVVVALFLIAIYKLKLSDALDGIKAGFRKALLPAVVTILIYTCLVIATYHPFQLMLYQAILGWSKTFNLFGTALVAMLSALFNADPSYAFQSSLPYFAGVIKDASIYPKVALLFQSMYGITMLVAPTSLILMLVLAYLKIDYRDWLKNNWLFVVVLLVLTLLVIAVWNVYVAYAIFAVLLIVAVKVGVGDWLKTILISLVLLILLGLLALSTKSIVFLIILIVLLVLGLIGLLIYALRD